MPAKTAHSATRHATFLFMGPPLSAFFLPSGPYRLAARWSSKNPFRQGHGLRHEHQRVLTTGKQQRHQRELARFFAFGYDAPVVGNVLTLTMTRRSLSLGAVFPRRDVCSCRTSSVLATWLAGCALLTAACSHPTLPSKTTIIPPPTITCPVAPSVTASNGQSVAVNYDSPTVSDGTAPVSVICAPPSGSTFNVGSTGVTCTATDAVRRAASCSFAVSVALPSPRLGVVTILAFGDSITEGEVPMANEFFGRPRIVEQDKAYPAQLATLLAQRYTSQGAIRIDAFTLEPGNKTDCWTNPPPPTTSGIVVINAGCLGEHAEDATTLSRLDNKLVTYRPDLVLLLEGVNDLNGPTSIPAAVRGVQALIAEARNRGARVIVGTLLPEIAGDVNAGSSYLIVPFNSQLVPAAIGAGATVVDLYSDISTDVTDWISPFDGLHPTEAGYQEIAQVFFNSIKTAFELPPSSTPTTTRQLVLRTAIRRGSRR
jgi:lysophospholipase L1-like esterase